MTGADESSLTSGSVQRVQLLGAVAMAAAGWMGVVFLFFFTSPTLGPRWVFFFLLFIALVGTALPLVWYLNRRFSPNPFPSLGVLWREAMIVGLWGVFLVWLRVGRLLTGFTLWSLTGAFFAVELLLRMYERSRWVPTPPPLEDMRAADSSAEGDDSA
ncbi:MAG: hypothetical protein ABSF61_08925 [Anaerolineales bacterium]|jgi:hypothetical protein